MAPKQIKILDKSKLQIKWSEENEIIIDIKFLRDECPCASCKGETILLKTYRPAKISSTNPDQYKIINITPVGEYAIQISWKDGHNTGIYSWDYLIKLSKNQNTNHKENYNNLI